MSRLASIELRARMPAEFVLDCESEESATASLLCAFGCARGELQHFLHDRAHLECYEANSEALIDFDQFLFQRACATLGTPRPPSEVCWFHCSRIPIGTTFKEGILPLGNRLAELMASLLAMVDEAETRRCIQEAFSRQNGMDGNFGVKVSDALEWGPFGILVRDAAFHARALGQVDYLAMPEIVVDLCDDLKERGPALLRRLRERWQPAIVKFKAPSDSLAASYLTTGLCYLRSCVLQGKPGTASVMGFNGMNVAVPPDNILRVDYL